MQMPPVTQNLILINALCWLASLVLPRFGIDLIELGGLHFPGTHTFHWFQPLTYMFLHDTHSIGHLFFNMFAVCMFGRVLEMTWGPRRFCWPSDCSSQPHRSTSCSYRSPSKPNTSWSSMA